MRLAGGKHAFDVLINFLSDHFYILFLYLCIYVNLHIIMLMFHTLAFVYYEYINSICNKRKRKVYTAAYKKWCEKWCWISLKIMNFFKYIAYTYHRYIFIIHQNIFYMFYAVLLYRYLWFLWLTTYFTSNALMGVLYFPHVTCCEKIWISIVTSESYRNATIQCTYITLYPITYHARGILGFIYMYNI